MRKPEEMKMIPVKLSRGFVDRIDKIVDRSGYRSRSEFIRDALLHYTKEVEAEKVIRIRNISRKQAKREIREYLKTKEKAWMDEIADDLRLDFRLVAELIDELEKGRLVGEAK